MKIFKFIFPILVLAIAIGLSVVIIVLAKKPPQETLPIEPRKVEVMILNKTAQKVTIESQGFVIPRAKVELAAEIAGRIVKTASNFHKGQFIKQGTVLLEIERINYYAALRQAEAQVAKEYSNLAQEKAEAEQARDEWKLTSKEPATELTLHLPQLREAEANLSASKAELEKAQHDLERTQVRAPFDALIFEKKVEVGEYVTSGTKLVTLYAVDFAEVRLPLKDNDLPFLDLPGYGSFENKKIDVTLNGRTRGRNHSWEGVLIRTENIIDEQTLQLYGVVHVADPYALKQKKQCEPLPVGLFVKAVIQTNPMDDWFAIPRRALRGTDTVALVDENKKVRLRKVNSIYSDRDFIYIGNDLKIGERVCLTAAQTVLEGEKVDVLPSYKTEGRGK